MSDTRQTERRTITISMPSEMVETITQKAAAEERSLSGYFRYHLSKYFDQEANQLTPTCEPPPWEK